MTFRLRDLPVSARWALLGFGAFLGLFYGLAHATLWERDGGGALPGPDAILAKYHGQPDATRLHTVLEADVPASSPKAMWLYLDPLGDAAAIEQRRRVVLDWAEAGAPRDGWEPVRRVLHQEATCLECHAFGGERGDLPLETFDQVRPLAEAGGGMALGTLLVSAHNHAFGFAVLALLLSLLGAFTGLPTPWKILWTVAIFLGGAVDVAAWFLTRAHGAPWQYAVFAGGALFGAAAGAWILAIAFELLRPARGGRGRG